jgi:hypothetical protein
VVRGTPFFTKLSGNVTGTPGSSLVKTSVDLTKEIRRGGMRMLYSVVFNFKCQLLINFMTKHLLDDINFSTFALFLVCNFMFHFVP